ncbi:hypothetical protein ACJ4V0_15790 [Phreatobacter sp. HK31-P]
MASYLTQDGQISRRAVMLAAHAEARQFRYLYRRTAMSQAWKAAKRERADYVEATRIKHPVEQIIGTNWHDGDDFALAVECFDAGRPCFIARGSQPTSCIEKIANLHSFADAVLWLDGHAIPAVSAHFGPGGCGYGRGLKIATETLNPINEAARWAVANSTPSLSIAA